MRPENTIAGKHLRCALNTPLQANTRDAPWIHHCRQTPEMRPEYTIAGKHPRCAPNTSKIPLQTLVVGETVLKVKVPHERIENPLSPCSGVQTFLLSPRLFWQSVWWGFHIKEKSTVHRKDRPGIFPCYMNHKEETQLLTSPLRGPSRAWSYDPLIMSQML